MKREEMQLHDLRFTIHVSRTGRKMINLVHKQVWVVRAVGVRRSFFTSCTARGSLLEAMTEAAKDAPGGDANLLSPACSSFDQFRNCQQGGEIFCYSVKSIGWGMLNGDPNINDKNMTLWMTAEVTHKNENLFRGFVRENPGAKKSTIPQ